MAKRMLSLLLCAAMLFSLIPFQASAVAQVRGDFLQPVRQITLEDRIPEGYTPIYTEADLRAIEQDPAGLYILMEDIKITSLEILCSSDDPFTGVLEGNGHTVSGIEIDITGKAGSNYYWGLFSTVQDARISNLKVSGSLSLAMQDYYSKGGNCYIGGVAGLAKGDVNISNCVNDVTISHGPQDGFKYQGTGGIVGAYIGSTGDSANITACRNVAEISSVYRTGGIIGYCELTKSDIQVTGCRNNALVTGYEASVGAGAYTGGILGELNTKYSSTARIYACMNTGKIDGRIYSGGIVSMQGLVSSSSQGSPRVYISSCADTGEVGANEQAGGIAADVSGHCFISDCINTGLVGVAASQTYCAGIVGNVEEEVLRCINTGKVICGSYNSAIAGTIMATEFTPEEMLATCYWLGGGNTNTLYRTSFWDGMAVISENGMLSAEQMKKEESFPGYEFPSVWTMDEERGHPFPTALLDMTLENTYEKTYIENTIAFADDSYRYREIFAGSGDGSFAGVLADTYTQANLDKVNGIWTGMQFVEGLANYTVEPVTGYDVLLADLIGGSVSRNIRDEHITTAALSMFSEVITAAGAGLDAVSVLQTEAYLADMAELPTLFGDPAKSLMDSVRGTVLKDIPFDDFSGALSAVGGVVNVAGATAAGCDSVEEVFDFYVLCNAHADTVRTYGDVIRCSAVRAGAYDAKEGSKLIESANEFVSTMEQNIAGDPTALYDAAGGAVANLAGVTGFTVLETVLKVKDLNPVLSVLDGVKTGITVGMPVADSLTNMDKIAYYGTMMNMCGTLSKGLFAEIQARRDAFAHSQSFEDAQALNVAATLYLNLQILACDYAIGYCNAIASSSLGGPRVNGDEIAASVQILCRKADLLELQKNGKNISVGTDGSINGFIARCPVTVTVRDSSGHVISRLETGSISGDDRYAGNFMLLGDTGEQKAGLYDPSEHTITFEGEGAGAMDLAIYAAEQGTLGRIDIYLDVPLEEGTTYTLTPGGLQGETLIPPTTTQDYNPLTHVHSHEPKVTAPTCVAQGYTTYSCYCGDTYVDDYVNPTGIHVYSDDADTTCNSCGAQRLILPPVQEGADYTPMYRLYNPNSGEHFYTGSQEETKMLFGAGWHYEGVAWNAPTKSGEPVYRLYNPNSGDHHYTMSAQERDMLVGYGWQYEGVCWNSAPGDQLPLYRLYNPNADCGSHHYTGSTEERDNLVQVGWIYEGIGWFGLP